MIYISNYNTGKEAADDIANVLSHNTKLQKFCAHNNNLQTKGAFKLAKSLQNTSNLTTFDISYNNIESKAADKIAAVSSCNTEVKWLD